MDPQKRRRVGGDENADDGAPRYDATRNDDYYREGANSVEEYVETPDMDDHAWGRLTNRKSFWEYCKEKHYIASGPTEVIGPDGPVVIDDCQLHPLLWPKYTSLIISDFQAVWKSQVDDTRENLAPFYHYTEFCADVWVRTGRRLTWDYLYEHHRDVILDIDWEVDLNALLPVSDILVVKYCLTFADVTARVSKREFYLQLVDVADAEEFTLQTVLVPESSNSIDNDVVYFPFKAEDALRPRHITEKELFDLLWLCMTDREKSNLYRGNRLLMELESFRTDRVNRYIARTSPPGQPIIIHSHLLYFARKMLLRNRQIELTRGGDERLWSDAVNICTMMGFSVVLGDYNVSTERYHFAPPHSTHLTENVVSPSDSLVSVLYAVLSYGRRDADSAISESNENGGVYKLDENMQRIIPNPPGVTGSMEDALKNIISGREVGPTPSLYQLLQRYLVVDPDSVCRRELFDDGNDMYGRLADIVDMQFATVPLVYGIMRHTDIYSGRQYAVSYFSNLFSLIILHTQRTAMKMSNLCGHNGTIRDLALHIYSSKHIATQEICNEEYLNSVNFVLPELDTGAGGLDIAHIYSPDVGKEGLTWLVYDIIMRKIRQLRLRPRDVHFYSMMLPLPARLGLRTELSRSMKVINLQPEVSIRRSSKFPTQFSGGATLEVVWYKLAEEVIPVNILGDFYVGDEVHDDEYVAPGRKTL